MLFANIWCMVYCLVIIIIWSLRSTLGYHNCFKMYMPGKCWSICSGIGNCLRCLVLFWYWQFYSIYLLQNVCRDTSRHLFCRTLFVIFWEFSLGFLAISNVTMSYGFLFMRSCTFCYNDNMQQADGRTDVFDCIADFPF
jgi:hypothetical protein